MNTLLLPIIIPAITAIIVIFIKDKPVRLKELLVVVVTLFNLILARSLFNSNLSYSVPWGGFGIDFNLRIDHFSSFILIAVAGFSILISLYCISSMQSKNYLNQFYSYLLITLSFTNGAVLADNLIVLLFFWEGLLLALFGMIIIGNKNAYKTAIKAFIIVGITDLCMMFGIGLTGHLAGTLNISAINLPLNPLGSVAFTLLMVGAISKAGAMPFHSWIPDAALDAPLPFMAFVPAALEKLLGIYFLGRISLNMFQLTCDSWVSTMMMVIGVITILLAVMMALIQKNYKKLLSYHAISQVGYMVLGIGTAVPAGIIGGLFHMLNHSIYKCCLFLTGGAVEKQIGTTDLTKLGGLGRKMPVTFICFIVAACSISGVPPFNGFFSKELVYDGALERNWIFYAGAVLGSFFTAASFLKLGHSAFLGELKNEFKHVKESPLLMLLPMILLASVCVFFGLHNSYPIQKLIQPILGKQMLEGHSFSGFPANIILVVITLIALAGAVLNHRYGVKKTGSGLGAADHIHYAPVLHKIYDKAEQRFFDPYDIGLKIVELVKKITWWMDRGIDYFYNTVAVEIAYGFTGIIKKSHNGNYSRYLLWALAGVVFMILYSLY